MRILKISTLALACVAGGLALSQANAEPQATKTPQSWIERMCSAKPAGEQRGAPMERRADRLATILQLTDAQKAALKDIKDARAKERADFKSSICANKPDLSTLPNRLAFREKMLQHRLDVLKAETPKLIAFYNSLDAKQKAAFEAMRGRMRGGMMMRMRERMMERGMGMGGNGGMGMGGMGMGGMGGPGLE